MLLVTGGAGFIGSNVVAALNEAGRTDIVVSDTLGSAGKWRNLQKRQLADFVRLNVCLAIMQVLHEGLADSKYRPARSW